MLGGRIGVVIMVGCCILIFVFLWFLVFISNLYLDSPFLAGIPERLGGIISVKSEGGGVGEFLWAHTTQSFCVGHMSCDDPNPRVICNSCVTDPALFSAHIFTISSIFLSPISESFVETTTRYDSWYKSCSGRSRF